MAPRLARGNTKIHSGRQASSIRRFVPAAALCAILLLAGSALADTDFTLTVEKGGSAPLVGKNVYLFSGAGAYLGQTRVTDSAGQAVFSLADGSYKFRVDTLGYQYFTPVLAVPGSAAYTFEILHEDVTVTVQKTFQSSTEPIAGVNTYLFTAAGAYQSITATTNSSGQAVFNVPAGSYKVRADWLNKQVFSDPFNQSDSTITFQQGSAEVTFTQGGNGISGVNTYVYSSTGTYLGISGQTGPGGVVEFILPTGNYKFRCDYQGSQYWSDVATLTADVVTPVEVDADGGVFTLTVTKGSSVALSGANAYVYTASGTYLGLSGQTNASGQVTFNLPAGDYKFRVDTLGYQYWTPVQNVPTTFSYSFEILYVDVTITVNKAFQGSSETMSGIPTYLYTEGGAYQGITATTNASGQAVFNVPAGSYKVRADWLTKQVFSAPFNQADATVTFEQGRADVTFIQGGNSVPGVNTYVYTAGGTYLNITGLTGSGGLVQFILPTGDYKFRGDYQGEQDWSDVATLTADTATPVTIDADGGVFTLTVTKGSAVPLTGKNVYVYYSGGGYLGLSGQTDSNGQVQFSLSDGSYVFRVDTLGYQYWSPAQTVPATLSYVFEIPHVDVTITVQKTFQSSTEPLAGVNTYLFTEAGAYQGISITTNSSGQAVFSVPAGSYKVRADWLTKQVLSAPFNQADTSIVFTQGRAEVTVQGPSGPIAGVPVYLFTASGTYLGLSALTGSGTPAVFTMPDNSYKFRADYGGVQ